MRGLASHLLSDPETRRNLFPPLPPLNNVFFISFFFLVAFLFIVQYFVRQFSHCAINSFCPNCCVVLVTRVINHAYPCKQTLIFLCLAQAVWCIRHPARKSIILWHWFCDLYSETMWITYSHCKLPRGIHKWAQLRWPYCGVRGRRAEKLCFQYKTGKADMQSQGIHLKCSRSEHTPFCKYERLSIKWDTKTRQWGGMYIDTRQSI